MKKFRQESSVVFNRAKAEPTVDFRGERSVTLSLGKQYDDYYSSGSVVQVNLLSAASLASELMEAIEAHYIDNITPKSPKDVL
ncbi:hypothetical protein ACFC1L_39750 [Streptomyces sp. NPDC056210]|uniref:hypothetical protein n=1 Tax=Streptomyces sp. NPDC056210 TaxID=3345746 RepID=UPI0035DA8D12